MTRLSPREELADLIHEAFRLQHKIRARRAGLEDDPDAELEGLLLDERAKSDRALRYLTDTYLALDEAGASAEVLNLMQAADRAARDEHFRRFPSD